MKNKKLLKSEIKATAFICEVYLKCINNERFYLSSLIQQYNLGQSWNSALTSKYIVSKGHKSMMYQWVGGSLTYQLIEEIIQHKTDRQSLYQEAYSKKIKESKDVTTEADAQPIELDFDKREPKDPSEVSADEFNMFKQLAKKLFNI